MTEYIKIKIKELTMNEANPCTFHKLMINIVKAKGIEKHSQDYSDILEIVKGTLNLLHDNGLIKTGPTINDVYIKLI